MRRTPVKITLDRERTLRYDLNAMCMVEELTGESLMDLMRKPTIKNLRTVIWAGLIHEDPNLTKETVGNCVELGDLRETMRYIHQALGLDIKTPDEENPTVAQTMPVKVNGSIGHNYGASDDLTSDSVIPISGV